MSLLEIMQVTMPTLPIYFLARYLLSVRPHGRRMIESWWLIGSNAGFAVLLLLGAATAIFGLQWPGRSLARGLSYSFVILIFVAEVTWLEYRLRRGTAAVPPDPPTRAEKAMMD